MTPLGTLDLSLPKKPDPGLLEQYVNPEALVNENTVLKVRNIFKSVVSISFVGIEPNHKLLVLTICSTGTCQARLRQHPGEGRTY